MNFFRLLALFALLFLARPGFARLGNPARADTASLRVQYDGMLEVSNRFQTFKVVRQNFLDAFIRNVIDSIAVYTNEIGQLKDSISSQASKIDEQAAAIGARDGRINSLAGDRDSISLLGTQLSKTAYNVVMWLAILLLLAALLFAIVRMRLAVSSSREARQANEKISAELEASRKSRLKVEQDLRRQLQDERNKQS